MHKSFYIMRHIIQQSYSDLMKLGACTLCIFTLVQMYIENKWMKQLDVVESPSAFLESLFDIDQCLILTHVTLRQTVLKVMNFF